MSTVTQILVRKMGLNAIARVVAEVPTSLHRRAKKVARNRRGTVSELIRDSLTKEIEYFEAKQRAEEAQEALDKAPKRKPSAITSLDQRPGVEIPVGVPVDRLAPLFEKHARRIMEVSNNPQAVAMRQEEAFAAIRKFAPLTYRDDDSKINERLESLIFAKATLEQEAEAVEPSSNPPPIMSRSLFSSAPAVTAPSGMNSPATAEMFALLRQMLTPQGQPVEEDPFAGRLINAAKMREQSVVGEEEDA